MFFWLLLASLALHAFSSMNIDFAIGFAVLHLAAMRWHLQRNSQLSGQELYRLMLLVKSGINEELRQGIPIHEVIVRAACPKLSSDQSEICEKIQDAISTGLGDDSETSAVEETQRFLDSFEAEDVNVAVTEVKRMFGVTLAPRVCWILINRPNL